MASELIERDLYAGKYHMIHNPNARGSAPRYKVMEGEALTKPKGVTTILGKVLAKDLVSWAVGCAVDYLEEKLPVITKADLKEAALAYTVKRDSGANTGSEAHTLVERFLKGKPLSAKDAAPSREAENAYNAFVKWFQATKPEVINVEEVIYSKEFGYAGTYDCMLRIEGKVYLCDLKTTNASKRAPQGVYAENFLQLGAYALAHEEQMMYERQNGTSKLEPVQGLMVISCKKDGKLDIVTETDLGLTLEDCQTMFKRVINLFLFLNYTTEKLGGK